jgi:DNA-binding NarL/FixJ family response regulator
MDNEKVGGSILPGAVAPTWKPQAPLDRYLDRDISIVLIDGHRLFRETFRAWLQARPPFVLVGEAEDGRSGCEAIDQQKPDLVLIEIDLPDMDGLIAIRQIRRRWTVTPVIVLAGIERDNDVSRALRAGATGYVLKRQSGNDLAAAMHFVLGGGTYLAPPYRGRRREEGRESNPLDGLTPRESQVLHLIVRGLPNRAIAEHLEISVRTVETHRKHINSKVSVHSPVDLVRVAARNGLIERVGAEPIPQGA